MGNRTANPFQLRYNLEDARIFAEVVRAGGYTAASRQLGIPKSTLSRRLSALEEALGVQLLRRTTRELALTSVGAEFHEAIARALGTMQEAGTLVQREKRDELSGNIRVTAPVDFANTQLGRIFQRYRARHPGVTVELLLTDRVLDLLRDRVDLALRAGAPVLAGRSESVISRKLSTVDFVVVAAPAYLKKAGTPDSVGRLKDHDGIYFCPESDGLMEWELHSRGRKGRADPRRSMIADSLPGILKLVVAGCGIALMPESLCSAELEAGRLVRLLPEWSGESTSAYLVFPEDKYQPLRVRRLIEEFVHEFSGKGEE